jgi:hypothetical protein
LGNLDHKFNKEIPYDTFIAFSLIVQKVKISQDPAKKEWKQNLDLSLPL